MLIFDARIIDSVYVVWPQNNRCPTLPVLLLLLLSMNQECLAATGVAATTACQVGLVSTVVSLNQTAMYPLFRGGSCTFFPVKDG